MQGNPAILKFNFLLLTSQLYYPQTPTLRGFEPNRKYNFTFLDG